MAGAGIVVYTRDTEQTFFANADGVTTDAAAINSALVLAAVTGGVVWLPPGTYAVDVPIVMQAGTTLTGQNGLRTDLGGGGQAVQPTLKPTAGFTGAGVVLVNDKEILGYAQDNSSVTVRELNIDCSLLPVGTVDGIQIKGKCDGLRLQNISILKPSNCGVRFLQYVRVDTNTYKTINAVLDTVVVHTSTSIGFSFNGNTDCLIKGCYSLGAGDDGFQFSTGLANTRVTDCRSEGSANHGFHITGAWNTGTGSGGMTMDGCSTDRSVKNGVLVDATGNSPVEIIGFTARRDGRNGGPGGGNFAGLAVTAATVPVIVTSPVVYPGVDDNGSGTVSPQYGISVTGTCTYVAVNGGGHLHAATTPWNDDGTSTVTRGPGISERIGTTSAPGAVSVDEWQRAEWLPEELGYVGWNYDPQLTTTTSTLVSGTIQLIRLKVRRARLVTNIEVYLNQSGAGITAGTSFAGLYSVSGGTATKLDVTADQSTTWAAAPGAKTMALAGGARLLPIGDYIVPLVSTFVTTAPGFARMSRIANAQFVNGKLGASGARFATNGTGTTLPATFTLSSNATSAEDIWIGLS